MIGNFRRLPEADLQRLLSNPASIADYLYEEERPGFGPCADLDIDKAWHGLHFLLTGTAWEGDLPEGFIVAGGTKIGDEDVGYGPARGLTAAQVKQVAALLEGIDDAWLRRRFEPKAMMDAEIYPTIWDRPPEEDDTLGYLLEYYALLRDFIRDAAREGQALLVYLS